MKEGIDRDNWHGPDPFLPADGLVGKNYPASSKHAAKISAGRTGSDRRAIVEFVWRRGLYGATLQEVEDVWQSLGIKRLQNVSCRWSELCDREGRHEAATGIPALLMPAGITRTTRAGIKAVVFVLSPAGEEALSR